MLQTPIMLAAIECRFAATATNKFTALTCWLARQSGASPVVRPILFAARVVVHCSMWASLRTAKLETSTTVRIVSILIWRPCAPSVMLELRIKIASRPWARRGIPIVLFAAIARDPLEIQRSIWKTMCLTVKEIGTYCSRQNVSIVLIPLRQEINGSKHWIATITRNVSDALAVRSNWRDRRSIAKAASRIVGCT